MNLRAFLEGFFSKLAFPQQKVPSAGVFQSGGPMVSNRSSRSKDMREKQDTAKNRLNRESPDDYSTLGPSPDIALRTKARPKIPIK